MFSSGLKFITIKFNVFFLDGDHTLVHTHSLVYFDNVLDDVLNDVFVFIVDDWNWFTVVEVTF